MRTRIALVAIIPIALITVALLMSAAIAQPARASIEAPHVASTHLSDQLTAFVSSNRSTATSTTTVPSSKSTVTSGKSAASGSASSMLMNASTPVPDIGASALHDFHKVIVELAMLPAPTAIVAPPVLPPPAPVVIDTVTSSQRAAWNRVANCEEGGNWQADGPRFSGGLGISRTNWAAYGGLQYASSGAQATPDQQIMVAQRIQFSPPDQYGCASW